MLTTKELAVGYDGTVLLSGLNLRLEAGSLVALLGRNGAGKSTLLRALTLASEPLAGSIEVDGRPVAGISKRERSRLIALVSTERIMAGGLTVSELVGLGRQPHTGFLGRLSAHDREVVAGALSQVGIGGMAGKFVSQLSDGERQKAMIARALAQETPIIVLDEPTAFLDAASRIEAMQLLASLAHEQGKAVLLSTHDISRSLLHTDGLWIITREGQVVAGTTSEMVKSEAMNRVFTNPSIGFNAEHCDYELQG